MKKHASGRTLFTIGSFLTLLLFTSVKPEVQDPFPAGSRMPTLGAVINKNGATGCDPLTGAALCGVPTGYSIACGGVSYYGIPGEASGPDGISLGFIGGHYSAKKIAAKFAFSQFDALSVYFEQRGRVSLGSTVIPRVRLSVEADIRRSGVRIDNTGRVTHADAGFTAVIPLHRSELSFELKHMSDLRFTPAGNGILPSINAGIHAFQPERGGLGALVSITPGNEKPVCFILGEEYLLTKNISLSAGFANNPFQLSFGMGFSLNGSDFGVGFVNHPVLGWSQGFYGGIVKGKMRERG